MPPLSLKALSPYQQHVRRWRGGCGSCICDGATKVFARGTVPCDVLLIGEAPGRSEAALGVPFVGPAGKLLDAIVAQAVPADLRVAFTNLVLCFPRDDESDSGKAAEPPKDAIKACAPRLSEFILLARPCLLVRVGALAKKHVIIGDLPCKVVDITHPAAILRSTATMAEMAVKRAVVTIASALDEIGA